MLTNFEQRWRKATKWSELGRRFKRVTHWHDDALIKLERISWILSPSKSIADDEPTLWVSKEDDPKNWHVQVKLLALPVLKLYLCDLIMSLRFLSWFS